MQQGEEPEPDYASSRKWYYVKRDEKVKGPFTIQDFARCLEQNELAEDTYVYNKHFMKNWERLKFVNGLLELLHSTPTKTRDYPDPPFNKRRTVSRKISMGGRPSKLPRSLSSPSRLPRKSSSPKLPRANTLNRHKSNKYKIGDVVLLDKNRSGRILFCGEVEFAKGQYYGIELIRGKGQHDGELDNKRYFTCKASQGVFVTRKQIVKKLKRQKDIALEYARHKWWDELKVLHSHGFVDDFQNVNLLDKHGTAHAVMRAAQNQIWDTLMGEQQKAKEAAQKSFDQWDVAQVKNWVASMSNGKFLEYATYFEENQIDGILLATMTENDLEKLGIFIMGHRKAIVMEIQRLTSKYKMNDSVLLSKNRLGAIRYIGEVSWDNGMWYGVELEEQRGTNDGSVDGRQYFNCRQNFGTFVQEKDVLKRLGTYRKQDSLESEAS